MRMACVNPKKTGPGWLVQAPVEEEASGTQKTTSEGKRKSKRHMAHVRACKKLKAQEAQLQALRDNVAPLEGAWNQQAADMATKCDDDASHPNKKPRLK